MTVPARTNESLVMEDTEAVERHGSALMANLFNALKLAFGQRIAAERLAISWWQATAFALLGIMPPLIYDFAVSGIAGEVAWENIPDALFHLPIFLLAAVATARSEEHTSELQSR